LLATVFRWVPGPPDARLATAALVLPALVWLVLQSFAFPPEPYTIGDYAKIEIYTRLAAEGSQRVGTESRFHFHHPGPSFFYAAAPIYMLLGESSWAMGVAALVWNLLAIVAFLRCAARLAPGTGPVVAALLLGLLLRAWGIGWLFSPWNPHVAVLPFGVVLLASARLAAGEGRVLALVLLAGSVAVQSHIVWALPVALVTAAGLALALWPALRRLIGIPTAGPGLGRGALLAGLVTVAVLWAPPIQDELFGEYGNLQRIVSVGGRSRAPRPWSESTAVAAHAFVSFAGAPGAPRRGDDPGFGSSDTGRLAAGLLLVVAAGVAGGLAARRRDPMAALALTSGLGVIAAVLVARLSPGRALPFYLVQWAAIVGIAAALVVAMEWLARAPRLRAAARGWPGRVALGLVAVALLASGLRTVWTGGPRPRDPRAERVERLARAVQEKLAERPRERVLVRVGPREDQGTVVGLLLALDKTGTPLRVEPFGSVRFEGHFTPQGNETAELLLGDVEAGPQATRVASEGLGIVWQPRVP
jgi:hypothetical protein